MIIMMIIMIIMIIIMMMMMRRTIIISIIRRIKLIIRIVILRRTIIIAIKTDLAQPFFAYGFRCFRKELAVEVMQINSFISKRQDHMLGHPTFDEASKTRNNDDKIVFTSVV